MSKRLRIDEIGFWSERKLEILRKYATAYSTIFNSANQRKRKLSHVYIDAFAGAGIHLSKTTGKLIAGSPLNALFVEPPFDEYHFIDLESKKIDTLQETAQQVAGHKNNVYIYHGDCNKVLLDEVFPLIPYEKYRRGLCLLDPYGLHLDWKVIQTAGEMKTVDVFVNFPVMDMNRNVFWLNPSGVDRADIERMNTFWGDESWRDVAYHPPVQSDLFGHEPAEKSDNLTIASAFCSRLKDKAGFPHVPDPLPMRNRIGGIIYYLIFASQNSHAARIVRDIFNQYRGSK